MQPREVQPPPVANVHVLRLQLLVAPQFEPDDVSPHPVAGSQVAVYDVKTSPTHAGAETRHVVELAVPVPSHVLPVAQSGEYVTCGPVEAVQVLPLVLQAAVEFVDPQPEPAQVAV